MSVVGLLDAVTLALRETGVPFMLTGSFAAAVHGAGRATMDVDLVVGPDARALDAFVQRMADAGYYVSAEAAREALAARTMFNVIDVESGWKVDLIMRKAAPSAARSSTGERTSRSDLSPCPSPPSRISCSPSWNGRNWAGRRVSWTTFVRSCV